MSVTVTLSQVFQLFVFAVVGFLLCRGGVADSKHARLLSCLGVYVFLPASIFKTYATYFTVEYISERYSLMIAATVILIISALVSIPISRLLTKKAYQQKVLQYSMTITNYGYIGYALVSSMFGDEMLLNVMVFALPWSLYTYSVGYSMLTHSQMSFKKIMNPPMLAILAGAIVGLSGLQLPTLATNILTNAANCMGPVSMLLTGMVVSEYSIRDMVSRWNVYVVAVIRLIVIPTAVALTIKALALDSLMIPALMMTAMPCGLNTIVFPKLIGEDCRKGASLAFVTNILCCITIPILTFLFL